MRSAFLALGVALGIGSLSALDTVGEGTRRLTIERFKNMLGTFDTAMVRPGAAKTRGMVSLVNVPPTLTFDDAEAIARLPAVQAVALVQNAFDVDVKYRGASASPALFGVSSSWLSLRGEEIAKGSFFSEEDDSALAKVAVLGPEAARHLFKDEDPVGKTVRVVDVPFEVVGVLRSRGLGPGGASLDDVVLIPVMTASRRLFHRDYLTMAIARLKEPEKSDEALSSVRELLRARHHTASKALDDFTVTSPRSVLATVTELETTLKRTLRGAGLLGLLVGGGVITMLMLSSLAERKGEIGIRRSVGATASDILLQFLLEAIFAACLGGALGAAIGVGAANLSARFMGLPGTLAWRVLLKVSVVSAAVGLVFGGYPALRAARIPPAEALRDL